MVLIAERSKVLHSVPAGRSRTLGLRCRIPDRYDGNVGAKEWSCGGNILIQDGTLELYVLGRITDKRDVQRIEEHLLVCTICQNRLLVEDAFTSALRTAQARFGWSYIHETADGEIRMFVYSEPAGKYIARIVGRGLDCGTSREVAADAQAWCEQSFSEMFPEHHCSPACR